MAVKPNKEKVIADIVSELNKGVERKDMIAKYCKKFQKSERTIDTYWKIANSRYLELQQSINKQIEIDSTESAKELLKQGLKSKSERLLLLQKQVDDLEMELHNNVMHFHSFSDGEIITGTRAMNSLERAKVSDVIKSIQSEISKIEGDYAAAKKDITVTEKGVSGFILED